MEQQTHSILKRRLELDDNSPYYAQLIEIILGEINAGVLKPGDQLPSEAQLCAGFGISRSTVRQAIGEIEETGLVIRRRGKGTFVSKSKVTRGTGKIYSFTSEMEKLGLEPTTQILEFKQMAASEELVQDMRLAGNAQRDVFCIRRLRIVDGVPHLLERTFVPVYLFPELSEDLLEDHSLYDVMEAKGIHVTNATESYETILINHKNAHLLKCDAMGPGFSVKRIASEQNGNVCEVTRSIIRGDLIKFVVDLERDQATVNYSVASGE